MINIDYNCFNQMLERVGSLKNNLKNLFAIFLFKVNASHNEVLKVV